jgi:hypothetical protein
MNILDTMIRKLVEPNRTSRFNVKPDSKLARASGLLSAIGSPEDMAAPMTTGGIAPSGMNLSLRDYEMDSNGLAPKVQTPSAVNMEQPKQVQNRLAENKSSDLSSKDVVKGLLKGLGAAAIGGMIGGDAGVSAVSTVMQKIKARQDQNKMDQAAKLRAMQQQEGKMFDRQLKEEEMGLKREDMAIKRKGMEQKAFNDGLGKIAGQAGTGLKAVFDYFKPPAEKDVVKIETAKARLENTQKQGKKLDMQMAGTLPSTRKSGGSSSGGAKAGKYPVNPSQFYNLSQEDQTAVISQMPESQAASFLLKARAARKDPKAPKPKFVRTPKDPVASLINEKARKIRELKVAGKDQEEIDRAAKVYDDEILAANSQKAMSPAAQALIAELRAARGQ